VNFTLEQSSEGIDLLLRGPWSTKAKSCLTSGRATGLVLNYTAGFQEPNLEFIRGLPIERLNILDRSVKDLDPVHSLAHHLLSLSVQTAPGTVIYLDELPLLRVLSADWKQVEGSIKFTRRLEKLFFGHYSEKDLLPLAHLSELSSLVMKDYPSVRSLDGVQGLSNLVELGIHLGRYLEDITALGQVDSSVLAILQLPACRKVKNLVAVASCSSLRFFDFGDGSLIPTLAPLGALIELERLYLYGSTKVADGDLGPVARLPRLRDFRMQNRRGYAPTVRDIQDVIASR
jgi:hypothetical protein